MLAETADRPQATKPLFTFEVLAFKPFSSGSLVGFCDVLIREWRLEIKELTVHQSHGKRWAGLPGKPMLKDGRVLTDDRTGKPLYSPVLKFHADRFRIAFSDRIVSALIAAFPNAFDGGGA